MKPAPRPNLNQRTETEWIKTSDELPPAGESVFFRTRLYEATGYLDATGTWHLSNDAVETLPVLYWKRGHIGSRWTRDKAAAAAQALTSPAPVPAQGEDSEQIIRSILVSALNQIADSSNQDNAAVAQRYLEMISLRHPAGSL